MKIGVTNSWLFVTMLACAGLSSGLVRAQDPSWRDDAVSRRAELVIQTLPGSQPTPPQPNSPYGNSGGGPAFFSGGRTGPNVTSAIRKAAEAVRDAKGDEAKSDAQKKLAEVLSKSYDDDMVGREKELKQIEERLAKLRDLLERRRTKKQEIIDLQTKVALNEAEGLGFYDNERPAKSGASGMSLVAPRVEINAAGPGVYSVDSLPAANSAPAIPKAPSR